MSNKEVLSLVQKTMFSDPRHQAMPSKLDRHDCLLKTVLEGKMEGKWPRGKPKRKMLDLLMEQEEKKISYEELKREAESRVRWRHHQWNLP